MSVPEPVRPRVLVVDDEAIIVGVFERVLRDEHDVVAFTSPRAALDFVAAGARFDAVFCDVLMPEMGAWEFLPALRRLDPALADRTVFVTGGAFTPKAAAFVEEEWARTLEKPVESDVLKRTVARVMRRQ